MEPQPKQMSQMSIEKVKERIVQWFATDSITRKSGADIRDSQQMDTFVADQFKNELKADGMLSAQYKLIESGKPINLQHLFKQILILSQISYITADLEDRFGTISVTDFTGNQLSLTVQNRDFKSIGYLFGFIEKMKNN